MQKTYKVELKPTKQQIHKTEIPFQIHVTLKNLLKNDKDKFLQLSKDEQVKPLLIELPEGKYINQPMFTKYNSCYNLEQALNSVKKPIDNFQKNGFTIIRIKIEVQPENDYLFNNAKNNNFEPYYEWHCKIISERTSLLEILCIENNAHLSLNSLDNDKTKYITIREYKSKELFDTNVKQFEEKLIQQQWQIVKQKFEYCIYDSKLDLDSGWAS